CDGPGHELPQTEEGYGRHRRAAPHSWRYDADDVSHAGAYAGHDLDVDPGKGPGQAARRCRVGRDGIQLHADAGQTAQVLVRNVCCLSRSFPGCGHESGRRRAHRESSIPGRYEDEVASAATPPAE